ncbi:four-carbon acid sugar kinase family protein [Halegenticoccus tardaugens]|uniref:four-carbon acid sugar kinase family protein n=1 Tax=Halegenticoccus tardaugens TaxID=2071624 RepID=UPI00100BE6FC|nr:four-carbon acid sugar kinase family protein [Halegenticoccus tardaugens]
MHSAVIVADDLTGAMDTAHGFAARGYRTSVLAVPASDRNASPDVRESAILGVNTDSRYADRQQAVDVVTESVTSITAEIVYKKVDSTLRGNLVEEVDAALTASDVAIGLVVPAFPAVGRTTDDGVHYVDGTPVAETEYGDDEKGPSSSSLSDLFEGLNRPVQNVYTPTIEAGSDRVASVLADVVVRNDHPSILICDASTDEHLSTIADASDGFNALYVGSGGLAEHISVPDGNDSPSPLERLDGSPLGIVGSVNATTLSQLKRVPDDTVIELDPVELLAEDGVDEVARRAAEQLQASRATVLTAATDRESVERTVEAGKARGLSPNEIQERVATMLGEAAMRTLQREEPSGLFLTGGDVAIAVIRALDATAVTLTGTSIGVGIPIGTLADGSAAGTPIVTKAGGFGTQRTIITCLDAFVRNDV